MTSNSVARTRILLGAIFLVALILVGKLYFLQIVHGSLYSAKANQQYVKPTSVIFDRGTVFFQSKDGTRLGVATVKDGVTIALDPKTLIDPQDAYRAIAPILAASSSLVVSQADFMTAAQKKDASYVEIAKKVDLDVGTAIQNLNIPGVLVVSNDWRYYPAGSMASQIIGITGQQSNQSQPTIAGRYGLESFYDNVLSRSSSATYVNFFAELFADIKSTVFAGQPLEGDIVSTIDPTVQDYLENILATTSEIWKPTEIGGIIIDPTTGSIYAMAHLPSFDPNDTADVSNPLLFSDPLVENIYEMGSIIKPLTMAAGLDSGAITPTTTYDDTGHIIVDGSKISNYDGVARGVIPMQQILSQSLNVGASFVAHAMGNTTETKYFVSYGLGSTTGIDLPNEAAGDIKNLFVSRDLEHDTASFGQGIAMSPIETARALSVIPSGGLLIRPRVVSEIDYNIGTTKTIPPDPGIRVLKQSSTDAVTHMLVNVVDQVIIPAHPELAMLHYSIAAKTGTAQIADPVHGGYYTDRYLHSYFGFFPAYKPRFLVFLYQVYPKGAEYASATLSDAFFDLAKFLVNYYQVPPDR